MEFFDKLEPLIRQVLTACSNPLSAEDVYRLVPYVQLSSILEVESSYGPLNKELIKILEENGIKYGY